MRALRIIFGIVLGAALISGGTLVLFFSDKLKPAAKAEEKEPTFDVPVHVAKVSRATLHGYIECFGAAGPAQLYSGGQPSTARIASPVAGAVTEVKCSLGEKVEKGAVLFQLDERVAQSEESKADAAQASARAAQASAQASLLKLKTSTRPEQIAIAAIAMKKAQQAVEFARLNHERQVGLEKDRSGTAKQVEDAASVLAAAREDFTSAEKQLALLKNSPAPEELAEAEAKIKEADAKITECDKALAAARLQRSLLTVKAPLSATVVKLNVYPGELVDVTNVVVELVDLSRMEISALVPSSELKSLKQGQPVEIFCSVPKKEDPSKDKEKEEADAPAFKGTLTALGQQVDPKTDLATVRVALPANSGVQPGQSARLRIMVEEHRDILAVPEECVFRDKTDIEVIAIVENGKSGLTNVKRGLSENGLVEVRGEDIKEGVVVVTSGTYGVPKEETLVHVLEDDKKSSARGKK